MPIDFMYITNVPEIAVIAQKYGVRRVWIDLETIGKMERQSMVNSVKSQHSIGDIQRVRRVLSSSELLVRVNPWGTYSEREIHAVMNSGADIIMLPMWKTPREVELFLNAVGRRTKTVLLLETREAVECLDQVMPMPFDEIYIGLNDLHLSYGCTFLFEPLASGLVEQLCRKFREKDVPYGFGGLARPGNGILDVEKIIAEHYRLGSTRAILSRSFCDVEKMSGLRETEAVFSENITAIRECERRAGSMDADMFEENRREVVRCVNEIVTSMRRAAYASV